MTDHATRVFRALADAVVPETPGLAHTHGPEHRGGAAAAAVGEYLRETFGGAAGSVTRALEVAAIELVVRRRNRDPLRRRGGRSLFARLSSGDRLRALRLLESEGVVPWLDDRLGHRTDAFGDLRSLVHALNVLVQFAYYSGLTAEDPLAWRQTGYPGPADGYAAHRGYAVERFEEDDY